MKLSKNYQSSHSCNFMISSMCVNMSMDKMCMCCCCACVMQDGLPPGDKLSHR